MEIRVTKSTRIGQKPRPEDSRLGFGKYTTDHMFLMDFIREKGWHNARIEPYGNLSLDPAAMVLHYNQEVFEGLKAYHLTDGGIGLFRPEKYRTHDASPAEWSCRKWIRTFSCRP